MNTSSKLDLIIPALTQAAKDNKIKNLKLSSNNMRTVSYDINKPHSVISFTLSEKDDVFKKVEDHKNESKLISSTIQSSNDRLQIHTETDIFKHDVMGIDKSTAVVSRDKNGNVSLLKTFYLDPCVHHYEENNKKIVRKNNKTYEYNLHFSDDFINCKETSKGKVKTKKIPVAAIENKKDFWNSPEVITGFLDSIKDLFYKEKGH